MSRHFPWVQVVSFSSEFASIRVERECSLHLLQLQAWAALTKVVSPSFAASAVARDECFSLPHLFLFLLWVRVGSVSSPS